MDDKALRSFEPQLAECRERLREVAFRSGGTEAAAMVGQAKLLRARLVLAVGSPLGASSSALLPAAVAIELLHLASLVHDDIIDDTAERRGMPALHVTVGRDRALVVGDSLIVAAFEALSQMRTAVRAEVFAGSVETLINGALLCCDGQLEELDPHRPVVSADDYLDVVAKKTGALFSVAASLGALIAGADDDLAAVAALGTRLGIAYQIRDDRRDGGEHEPGRQPTFSTYARAIDDVHSALDRVPADCSDSLRTLVEAVLGRSVAS